MHQELEEEDIDDGGSAGNGLDGLSAAVPPESSMADQKTKKDKDKKKKKKKDGKGEKKLKVDGVYEEDDDEDIDAAIRN